MVLDYQPYSMIKDKGFIHLFKVAEPRHKLPQRTTFSRNVIPRLYNVAKKIIINLLIAECKDSIPAMGFTTDMWTLRTLDKYINFTVSFITEDFHIRSIAR